MASGNPLNGVQNLKPLNKRSAEEKFAIQSKGGKQKGINAAKRREAKEQLKMFLELHPEVEKKIIKNLTSRAQRNTKDYVEILKIIGEYNTEVKPVVDTSINITLKID